MTEEALQDFKPEDELLKLSWITDYLILDRKVPGLFRAYEIIGNEILTHIIYDFPDCHFDSSSFFHLRSDFIKLQIVRKMSTYVR